MPALRRADATWSGDLMRGSGKVTASTSHAFADLPVSWASRTEAPDGRTRPEELLAAAHAPCCSLPFSNGLAKAGHPPERLDVSAEVTFDKVEAGWRVTRIALTVRGGVPGSGPYEFASADEAAKDGCPVSQALSPSIDVSVEAALGR